MKNEISIVIGSWGSYNECNERALGSKWLKLSDYSNWKDIEKELIKQGFELDGIDEELFIQDVEGLPSTSCNWDYTHPKQLFELLKEYEELVNSHGSNWIDFEAYGEYMGDCYAEEYDDKKGKK